MAAHSHVFEAQLFDAPADTNNESFLEDVEPVVFKVTTTFLGSSGVYALVSLVYIISFIFASVIFLIASILHSGTATLYIQKHFK